MPIKTSYYVDFITSVGLTSKFKEPFNELIISIFIENILGSF